MTSSLSALPAPYRYERADKPADAGWQGRPIFNIYGPDGTWIGRVADETAERAEAHARRHAVVRLMEAALRAIAASPEAAIALSGNDHPAWSALHAALTFIDRGPAPRAPQESRSDAAPTESLRLGDGRVLTLKADARMDAATALIDGAPIGRLFRLAGTHSWMVTVHNLLIGSGIVSAAAARQRLVQHLET